MTGRALSRLVARIALALPIAAATALPARADAPVAPATSATSAGGPSAPQAAPSAPPAAELARAKELFREGVVLFESGDVQGALERFLGSRAQFASMQNTLNAALCFERLGRPDEALELVEDALVRFAGSMTPGEASAARTVAGALRDKTAALEVSASVPASLVVDGRPRGDLPRVTPLRVAPGRHVVRVMKDGYETFEQAVAVEAGRSLSVDAALRPLRHAGRLRVETGDGSPAGVFVVGSSRVDLQACKLEYSIVSPK